MCSHGYYAAFYIAASGNTHKITIHDTIAERAENTASLLQQNFPELETTACTEQPQSDVVVLATNSHHPIYDDSDQAGSLIVSVGADTHWQREVSKRLLDQVEIYVDTHDSLNCGDLRQWSLEKEITDHEVTDLLTLLRDRPEPSKPALFISTGSALFDNLTIDYLLENIETFTEAL